MTVVFKERWRQEAWDSWPFDLQLPDELVIPADTPNTEESIRQCIDSQRVWKRHNRDSARVQGHGLAGNNGNEQQENDDMRISEQFFPSKYFSVKNFPRGEELLLTIAEAAVEEFDEKEKPVLVFEDEDKQLVLNRTNTETLEGLFGMDTDSWGGKEVVLFLTKHPFNKADTLMVREHLKPKLRRPAAVQAEESELEEVPF